MKELFTRERGDGYFPLPAGCQVFTKRAESCSQAWSGPAIVPAAQETKARGLLETSLCYLVKPYLKNIVPAPEEHSSGMKTHTTVVLT
jgi:hypothetical protein